MQSSDSRVSFTPIMDFARCIAWLWSRGAVWLTSAVTIWAFCDAARVGAAEQPSGLLRLRDGSQLDARWQAWNDAEGGDWHTSVFEQPIRIPPGAVESFSHSTAVPFPLPDEFWEARLRNGSVLRGRLISLDRETVVWHCLAANAEVVLERGAIGEIRRRSGMATVVYQGLQGLRGWRDEWGRTTAVDRRGTVQIDGPGILRGDLGLPERSVSEIEISWRGRPNFGLQWGVREPGATAAPLAADGTIPQEPRLDAPPDEEAVARASDLRPFNLEVLRGELLAMAETRQGIVQRSVQVLGEPGGRLAIRVYLDQKQGRMVVTTTAGVVLCDLSAREPDRVPGGAMRLVNGRGVVRFERLRIWQWDGELPRPGNEPSGPTPERRRRLAAQTDTRLERGGQVLLSGSGPNLREVPLTQVELLVLAAPGKVPVVPAEARTSVVELVDGSQWRGTWQGGESGVIVAGPPVIGSWEIPLRAIRVVTWQASRNSPVATTPGWAGVLQNETLALAGTLVGVRSTPAGPRLEWQPSWGGPAGLLRASLVARMMFRDETSAATSRGRTNSPEDGRDSAKQGASPAPDSHESRLSLRLLTGETIDCATVAWREDRLEVTLPDGARREFAESDLQSLEFLSADVDGSALSSALREALVTIPRLRQARPPTHLVRSQTGDFLRGRLVRIDESELVLEVREREQRLPRHVVAAIVWLHPPPELSNAPSEKGAPARILPKLQGWNRGRAGVGVSPLRLEESRLVCEDSLGREVILPLDELDGLLLGDWRARDPRAAGAWRWKAAVQPRFVNETTEPPTE
jgi:hypothetical protein